MLQLRDIKKSYAVGDTVTTALKGISVGFRKSEFVAILGPSGCGKTTLLNVIGGLDKYDSGDLIINGRSTKEYKDSDWDSYRNHSIGFVFQSYNLIPHQTVLANVELALTLSGVSKTERKAKALEALGKVGIADQAKKKPNQLSGGQMQRVAIARALVNNPDILLADEPTGALDTATSVQIMELLKEISKDKLVIMVTHNPELANDYATRIVNLKDGEIISDANPVIVEEIAEEKPKKEKKKGRKTEKTSMSFFTALSLSLNNLMTKKTRTMLTSFAGSIGIIGIALILSLSSGFKAYINKVQEDTLSTYPIQITSETLDMTGVLTELSGSAASDEFSHELDKVYARPIFGKLINTLLSEIQSNDLKAFKAHLDENKDTLAQYTTDIKYTYGVNLDVYSKDTSKGVIKVNPMEIFNAMMGSTDGGAMMGGMSSSNVWNELLDNQELLDSQYDIVDGKWPEAYNEVVLFVDENNEINDYILCGLGLIDQASVYQMMSDIQNGKTVAEEMTSYSYDEILGLEFSLVPSSLHYVQNEETGIWENKSKDELHMKKLINKGVDIKIVGIMRPKESATATSATSMIGYTHALTEHCIALNNDSPIVKQQLSEEIDTATSKKYGAEYKFCDVDVFTGIPFGYTPETKEITMEDVYAYIAALPEEQQQMISQQMAQMTEEQILESFGKEINKNTESTVATLKTNLIRLGAAELDTPSAINIYAKDFESKDFIASFIDDYNQSAENDGAEEKVIRYTDLIGIMMSSVSTIIDVISYVLIAFVSISLVVSSIMIGIITYISVLERTKEIGILRSIGASKKDITRVFNAETLIVGFVAGALGILTTILLNIPINAVIYAFGDIQNVSKLPVWGAIALVIISMVLTWFAGLIPSRVASKKDPVVALRTE